jgi:hypothetical protein
MTFAQLVEKRREEGAKEYGSITFLGNDVIRMMIEELADTVNYCTMQAVKLMLLQDFLGEEVSHFGNDGEINLGMGVGAFKGTAPQGWVKS